MTKTERDLFIDLILMTIAGQEYIISPTVQIELLRELIYIIEVKEYVFKLFHQLGTRDGGIIACGEISEDVPLKNIKAMYEAFTEFKW